jgi:hypothetical protein
MKNRIERVGSIYISVPDNEKPVKKRGAAHLRNLVAWMNDRNETLNENKSALDVRGEYNIYLRDLKK